MCRTARARCRRCLPVRRRARQAETDDLAPPADTRICFVQDWISADEIDSHSFAPDCPAVGHVSGGFADCRLHLERLAKRRHAEHRAQWLAQHGVPLLDQFTVWPAHRARWRSAAARATASPRGAKRGG